MLTIQGFAFNPFQENTYLIFNENKECWIIDPGMFEVAEEQMLYDFITENQLKPQQIINTHGHIDHIFGIDSVKQKYGIHFGLHPDDEPIVRNAANSAALFGIP